MKKQNKKKNQQNRRKERRNARKQKAKKERNKEKRLTRWLANVEKKRAERETYHLEEEIRKIQAKADRENQELIRQHLEAQEAAKKTEENLRELEDQE